MNNDKKRICLNKEDINNIVVHISNSIIETEIRLNQKIEELEDTPTRYKIRKDIEKNVDDLQQDLQSMRMTIQKLTKGG